MEVRCTFFFISWEAATELQIYFSDESYGIGLYKDGYVFVEKWSHAEEEDKVNVVAYPAKTKHEFDCAHEKFEANRLSGAKRITLDLGLLDEGEEDAGFFGVVPKFSIEKPKEEVKTVSGRTNSDKQQSTGEKMSTNQTMAEAEGKLTRTGAAERPEEKFKNVGFERVGTKVILPENMTFAEAIKWMERKAQEEEAVVAIHEVIDAYVLDGAHAFAKAIARTYGFSAAVPTPGFFSSPPAMIGFEIGVGEDGVAKTVQVPWGAVQIPGLAGTLQTGFEKKESRFVFSIQGEVKQKHRGAIADLAELTRKIVREESVFRGQAIRVRFPLLNEKFSPLQSPKFIDLSKVNENELLFNDDVNDKIRTSIFNPVEKTSLCRKFQIPLKTGVLLAGKFGTGKTMTANHAAKKCVRNGWTFVYLENVGQLKEAILFAKQYQPALIFAEDIDRVLDGARDAGMDEILNTIDGVDTKNSEVMVVLTTNALDKIHKAMLRPGRLDSVIEVTPPDAKTAVKLIRLYGRGLINDAEDLTEIGEMLSGQIPASIQQVVEKSKRAALTHLQEGEDMLLKTSDLRLSANVMLDHLKLLVEDPEDRRTDIEKMGAAIGEQLASGMRYVAEEVVPAEVNRFPRLNNGKVVKAEPSPS